MSRGSCLREFLGKDQEFKDTSRDFLVIGLSQFKDKSPVQSTGEGSQGVRDERKEKRLDWYD